MLWDLLARIGQIGPCPDKLLAHCVLLVKIPSRIGELIWISQVGPAWVLGGCGSFQSMPDPMARRVGACPPPRPRAA